MDPVDVRNEPHGLETVITASWPQPMDFDALHTQDYVFQGPLVGYYQVREETDVGIDKGEGKSGAKFQEKCHPFMAVRPQADTEMQQVRAMNRQKDCRDEKESERYSPRSLDQGRVATRLVGSSLFIKRRKERARVREKSTYLFDG